MNISSDTKVGRLVVDHPVTADVFEKYGIDFCCNGNKTLAAACEEKQISFETLRTELLERKQRAEEQNLVSGPDFRTWPLDLLADYIEKTHHRYVERNLPALCRYLEKIKMVHGQAHPELETIAAIFSESAGELTKHMKKEELILFPFIRKLSRMKEKGQSVEPSAAGAVQHPVRMMMHDHDAEGERFRKIAKLSNNYTPPADSCATYRAAYAKLEEFERDLHQHIHLENNLLFPRAIEMEKQLSA
ncbi:MAG: iron-sulfur cluster repair di-iron protein [Solitalea sp.]